MDFAFSYDSVDKIKNDYKYTIKVDNLTKINESLYLKFCERARKLEIEDKLEKCAKRANNMSDDEKDYRDDILNKINEYKKEYSAIMDQALEDSIYYDHLLFDIDFYYNKIYYEKGGKNTYINMSKETLDNMIQIYIKKKIILINDKINLIFNKKKIFLNF